MSSSYQPCPAIKLEDGYLVLRRVEKAFPVFLRCAAAYFPLHGPEVGLALRAAELAATPAEFSAAAGRLVSQPMLQSFSGGVPVLVYVARPGKEELFLEFADGLDQADDFQRLRTVPTTGAALALVFGDPSVPLGDPPAVTSTEPAPYDQEATAMHLPPVLATDEMPTWMPANIPQPMLGDMPAPDLQPQPPLTAAPPEPDPLPPVEVVVTTTSALDDLLRPAEAEAGAHAADEAAEAPAFDPLSEPALEILLRKAPRLQAPDSEVAAAMQSIEPARGPSPEEVLVAVRQVATALDSALQRQATEHNKALQTVLAATAEQSRALEARQAELWDRQQQALRQMHTDQANAIQQAIVRLDEERAAWQQRALREVTQASAQQLPTALRQMQDELAARQQQTLNQLREDLINRQPQAAAAPTGPLVSDESVETLNWQLEKSAVSSQDLRQRVGQLLAVNIVLIIALMALAAGAYWLLRGLGTPAPAPTSTVAPTVTLAPTTLPPTEAPPTDPPSTATTAATATAAATALPVFVAALSCANTDRPRNFYDCELTNGAAISDTLAIAIQAADDELNGFNPLVMNDEQRRITPDPITGLFFVGALAPGETRAVRVLLPCAIAAGCAETTFSITPLVDAGQTLVAEQVVEVTTHYFPPEGGTAP